MQQRRRTSVVGAAQEVLRSCAHNRVLVRPQRDVWKQSAFSSAAKRCDSVAKISLHLHYAVVTEALSWRLSIMSKTSWPGLGDVIQAALLIAAVLSYYIFKSTPAQVIAGIVLVIVVIFFLISRVAATQLRDPRKKNIQIGRASCRER